MAYGMNACNLQLIPGGAKNSNGNQRQAAKKLGNPFGLIRDILKESLMKADKKVRLVALFNMVDIQKEYNGYTMVYDGRAFRKLVPGLQGTQTPSRQELVVFAKDIVGAAKEQKDIHDFMVKNPLKPALENYLKST